MARLPGRILWSVHMGSFNSVDRDRIQEHKFVSIVRDCHSFVYSCNFTYKANLHTPKGKIHTDKDYAIFANILRKRSCSGF